MQERIRLAAIRALRAVTLEASQVHHEVDKVPRALALDGA